MFGYRSPVDDLALEACCKDILFNPVECDLRTAFAADVDFRAAGQSIEAALLKHEASGILGIAIKGDNHIRLLGAIKAILLQREVGAAQIQSLDMGVKERVRANGDLFLRSDREILYVGSCLGVEDTCVAVTEVGNRYTLVVDVPRSSEMKLRLGIAIQRCDRTDDNRILTDLGLDDVVDMVLGVNVEVTGPDITGVLRLIVIRFCRA